MPLPLIAGHQGAPLALAYTPLRLPWLELQTAAKGQLQLQGIGLARRGPPGQGLLCDEVGEGKRVGLLGDRAWETLGTMPVHEVVT